MTKTLVGAGTNRQRRMRKQRERACQNRLREITSSASVYVVVEVYSASHRFMIPATAIGTTILHHRRTSIQGGGTVSSFYDSKTGYDPCVFLSLQFLSAMEVE